MVDDWLLMVGDVYSAGMTDALFWSMLFKASRLFFDYVVDDARSLLLPMFDVQERLSFQRAMRLWEAFWAYPSTNATFARKDTIYCEYYVIQNPFNVYFDLHSTVD